jgi:hypothetical protein
MEYRRGRITQEYRRWGRLAEDAVRAIATRLRRLERVELKAAPRSIRIEFGDVKILPPEHEGERISSRWGVGWTRQNGNGVSGKNDPARRRIPAIPSATDS